MDRAADLDRFRALCDRLRERVGGARRLADCDGYMYRPDRGVYLPFAPGETRAGTDQPWVTRVGTHAVSAGSSTTLRSRLRAHYGTRSRSDDHPHGGSHRGSVYRTRVGEALIERHGLDAYPEWGRPWSGIERDRAAVRVAGLRNVEHTDATHDPAALDRFERAVAETSR